MNKKNEPFVATNDEETAEMLRKCGFIELPKQGNRWMFLNKQSDQKNQVEFSFDTSKVHCTNKLVF